MDSAGASEKSNAAAGGGSTNEVTQPRPPDVRHEWNRPIARRAGAARIVVAGTGQIRVVHEERPATDVLSRNDAPIAAVLRAVAVVAHHEEMILRYDDRSPVAKRRLRGRRAEARIRDL